MVDDLPEMDERIWSRLPNIARLFLDQGVRFTRYYGNDPLCCPGRSAFLTGQTTDHHGVYTNDPRLLKARETLATELNAVGYYTFIAGKYLNGTDHLKDKTPPGWDRVAIFGAGYYFYNEWLDGTQIYHDNDINDYSVDVFANRALQFLRDAPPAKPVFAYLTPFAVHAGKDRTGVKRTQPVAPVRFQGDPRCADVPAWDPPNYDEADVSDKPAYIRHLRTLGNTGRDLTTPCEALLSVDELLGRVVAELQRQDRLSQTLFILTADNGMGYGAHRWLRKDVPYATQMTLYAHWAEGRGLLPETNDSYLSNTDLAPTICALAGCRMGPFPNGQSKPDGWSFLPLIEQEGAGPVRGLLYEEHLETGIRIPPWHAIRTTPSSPLGLWHYVEYQTGEIELYDASGPQCWEWTPTDPGDPCELTNLAGDPAHADVQAALAALLAQQVATGGARPEGSVP